ncbi:hypothetical protein BU24DRAFT_235998 [Aaosphaeria arxii CBS 175.79]|uniref:Uncharacterized protein n=1 Tax=Aaosphaeria arxii CBS 175.79 TaxID=1450172 RepID=A0A6A5XM08_9PLEO|nr:uncharacterized protein BU24DRAFT_235998 [Aaosphaeria arxii CBS 175.79]KAF2013364.1 hypothetical protein BU24DRAFT_235998 [Aaosphaeria arxii CBS 175.79]
MSRIYFCVCGSGCGGLMHRQRVFGEALPTRIPRYHIAFFFSNHAYLIASCCIGGKAFIHVLRLRVVIPSCRVLVLVMLHPLKGNRHVCFLDAQRQGWLPQGHSPIYSRARLLGVRDDLFEAFQPVMQVITFFLPVLCELLTPACSLTSCHACACIRDELAYLYYACIILLLLSHGKFISEGGSHFATMKFPIEAHRRRETCIPSIDVAKR